MNIKAVIWDLDGTLLDTLDDLTASTNAALAQNGLPVRTREEVRRFVGNGIRRLMMLAVPGGEANPAFDKALEDFTRHYGTAPLDGVPNFALLGYDCATYILRNIQANKGTFDPEVPARHIGLQSSFDIKPYDADNSDSEAGYYNDAIYIITYLSGDSVTTSVL